MAEKRETTPETIIYKPEWNAETEKYMDVCPFEPNHSGTKHICRCRNQEDKFNKMTDYKKHIKNKYHTDWVKAYGIYSNKEIDKLTQELKRIEKENSILHASLEKQTARAERYKIKYDKMKKEIDEYDRYADCD
jgi:predicted nuclease with TOPRIM domain